MSKYDIEKVQWPDEGHTGTLLAVEAGASDAYPFDAVVPAKAYAELLAVAAELAKTISVAVEENLIHAPANDDSDFRPSTATITQRRHVAALAKFHGGIPSVPLDDFNTMLESGRKVIDNGGSSDE